MRVLFPFVGDSVGGSHVSALLLIEELQTQSVDAHVLLHHTGPLTEALRERGIAYEVLGGPRAVLIGKGQRKKLAQIKWGLTAGAGWLRDQSIDIVHTNDGRMHRTWSFAAGAARVRHVWHQRTVFAASPTLRAALPFARRIVSISRYVEGTLPRWARRKSSIVHNPFHVPNVSREQARAQLNRGLGLSDEVKLLAFVGNLSEQKRPSVLVPVARELRSYGPTKFVILVYGADRSGIRDTIESDARREDVTEHIRFMGFDPDVQRNLAGCDLLIAPAVNEGFGRALVEAMMVGTPVVAADSGAHGEVIEHRRTGLLFPPDNVTTLAASCFELLRDDVLWAALSKEGERDAMARFSVEAHTDEITSIYTRCLTQDKRYGSGNASVGMPR